jgi:hypothetical protein
MELTKYNIDIMWNDFNGKNFISECSSNYRVEKGRFFFGKNSAEIELISAFDEAYYLLFRFSRPDSSKPKFKEDLEHWIKNCYYAPTPGDYIAVTFTDDYAERNQRYGYVTSRIKKIQRTQ